MGRPPIALLRPTVSSVSVTAATEPLRPATVVMKVSIKGIFFFLKF
jgi:hypothetical protein